MRHEVGEFIKQIVSDPIGLAAGFVGAVSLVVAFLWINEQVSLGSLVASVFALELASFRAWRATYRQTRSLMGERADRAQAIIRKLPADAIAFLKMLSEVRDSTTPPHAIGVWGLKSAGIVTQESGTGLYRLSDGYETIIRRLLPKAPTPH